MDQELDYHALRAALEWQVELGATEAIGDVPVDRTAIPASAPKQAPAAASGTPDAADPPPVSDPVQQALSDARVASARSETLTALREALAAYPHCELRKGARNLVFADGQPGARVMILGEAPGRDEDREGRPFVGRAGQLLDRMFNAIGLSRTDPDPAKGLYITNVLPWRPPQNRDPRPDEIAMMMPFVQRHVALVDPDILVLMGNISCQAALGRKGITRLRGQWTEAMDRPVLPMFHPAFLLRQPAQKRATWADLLSLQAKLRGLS
ncbi:uracil-DNA glycosylase [Dinoroseobacter sp. S76]|uniref:uracil-DNA glycosylase n=1 Tax=Dinoroseobacter sp. S76 TaxID=3415124 RepID=UPI003C7AAD77